MSFQRVQIFPKAIRYLVLGIWPRLTPPIIQQSSLNKRKLLSKWRETEFRVNNLEVAKLRRMDWVVGMWNCNVELQFLELSSVPGTELMSVPEGLWNCSSRPSRKGNFFFSSIPKLAGTVELFVPGTGTV